MSDKTVIDGYLAKADESLASAESDYVNGRYNSCANRCYYACFQAAIAALLEEAIQSPGHSRQWGHEFVSAQFVGRLINRRKRFSSDLRATLARTYDLRQVADYSSTSITETQANRSVARAREFVDAVANRG